MTGAFRLHFNDAILGQVYDYWLTKRHDRLFPARSDIEPTELRRLLPYLMLSDVVDGGDRIRFRLVGTNMVTHWGGDFTGKHLDEVMSGTYRDFMMGLYRDTIRQACPIYSRSRFRWDVGRSVETERLFMPLGEDDDRVDTIFIGQTFAKAAGQEVPVKVADHGAAHIELSRVARTAAG